MWNTNEIIDLIDTKHFTQLKEIIKDKNSADIAELMDVLDVINAVIVFRLLPKETAVEVFSLFSEKNNRHSYLI